jgi:hypothetical protein
MRIPADWRISASERCGEERHFPNGFPELATARALRLGATREPAAPAGPAGYASSAVPGSKSCRKFRRPRARPAYECKRDVGMTRPAESCATDANRARGVLHGALACASCGVHRPATICAEFPWGADFTAIHHTRTGFEIREPACRRLGTPVMLPSADSDLLDRGSIREPAPVTGVAGVDCGSRMPVSIWHCSF